MQRYPNRWVFSLALLLIAMLSSIERSAAASTDELLEQLGVNGTVLDMAPFDVITLTEAAGGRNVQVHLLDLPGRKVPAQPKPTDRLDCVISLFPDRNYEIYWRDIAKITLWEQLVLDRCKSLLKQKRFAESFEHLNYLLENYPSLAGLEGLHQDFLFSSARDMAAANDYPHALAALEELHRLFPNYRSADIRNAISGVAGRLLEDLLQRKQYAVARTLLSRLEQDYQDGLSITNRFRERLSTLANTFKSEAIAARDRSEFMQARKNVSWMLAVDPEIAGGRELQLEILRAYPMIRVGVQQESKHAAANAAVNAAVNAIGDWPAFRAGRLTQTPLFSFRNAGPEGGIYQFAYGTARLSDDRLAIDMVIQSSGNQQVPTAALISQALLERANVESATYSADWASILKSVSVPTPDRLTLHLRRPHVIPQAMLQWELPSSINQPFRKALYQLKPVSNSSVAGSAVEGSGGGDSGTPHSVLFDWASDSPPADFQPRVIEELTYRSPGDAISDLLRGDIELIDRLFPADARRLSGQSQIKVEPYALPTVHMLVPKSQDPFIQNIDFRRALLYGINRSALLNDEILGGAASPLDRLASGPFPIGAGDSDAIAYANDSRIAPLPYDPRSATVLLALSRSNVQSAAIKKKQPAPSIPTIRLGVPNYEAAIVAGQGILQSWKVLGIDGTLIPYDHIGDIPPNSIDLMYLTAAVWEPVTDAEKLFGAGGPAETNNAYVVQSLTKLKEANNWREVKEACHELHAMVASQLPILPLWQISEYFAYRTDMQGIARKPVALYQDIHRWRIQPQ